MKTLSMGRKVFIWLWNNLISYPERPLSVTYFLRFLIDFDHSFHVNEAQEQESVLRSTFHSISLVHFNKFCYTFFFSVLSLWLITTIALNNLQKICLGFLQFHFLFPSVYFSLLCHLQKLPNSLF